jgi:DNA polymerase-1
LRREHPDFRRATRELRRLIKRRKGSLVLVVHAALYDIEMMQGLGLDFLDANLEMPIFDTMMAAYLLCVEPQALKALARRHCGMEMRDYQEVVGKAGLEKQLAYLERVWVETGSWPKPEPRVETGNDGTTSLYTPQSVSRRAEAILTDFHAGKLDKEGRPTDPLKRWRKVDRELRRKAEKAFGPMPIGTLADVPLADAVHYAARDPDATLRLYPKMAAALEAEGLTPLMDMKMGMLPAAAAMKINGLMGVKSRFEGLSVSMQDQMDVIRDRISREYFQGRPFNPASSDQTATLMRRRGLVGEKRTPKGAMSTSKKSIEHLRFEDPAIEELEQWRERAKIKDSFADPVLENWPDDPAIETCRIKCDLKITRVTSGRFSATLLNDVPSAPLLAIPVRNDLGKSVRDCYVAEEGYVLGSWDLDQAEMRIMADESGDERLVKLFCDGKVDIHTDTASKIFGVPYDQVDKMKHRYPAKRVGFGVITGIQGPGLLDQLRMAGILGWDVKGCEKLIREWLNLYPGVNRYMEWCRSECRKNGGVIRDRWGMLRYLPAILDDSREGRYDRLEAERQTHSHAIQGGAQGHLQMVMGYLWRTLRKYGDAVRFVLQIHDEIVLEVAQGLEEEVSVMVIDAMVNRGARLIVPIKSSGSYAGSWGKLKD